MVSVNSLACVCLVMFALTVSLYWPAAASCVLTSLHFITYTILHTHLTFEVKAELL